MAATRGGIVPPQVDSRRSAMLRHLSRLVLQEDGDDLVEYALLATVIGTAGAAVLAGLPAIMNVVYASWDAGAQALWEPPDPAP